MTRESVREAVRYWEPRRLWYNLLLAALGVAWVIGTWPHFRHALTLGHSLELLVLVALANLCYSAAYLVDIPLQRAACSAIWQRQRWMLWWSGTLFALIITYYWIADEIYPSV
ncbi:MAG: hypothetical protein WCE48_02035 [Steroidobacteraceae bacterium]